MAKGDDAILKKQNKARRKKLHKDSSSNVSARVADIIAAKKRRKSGKRRMCEGMCFSLPTPDDPFNDRHGKKASSKKETNKEESSLEVLREGKSASLKKENVAWNSTKHSHDQQKKETDMVLENERGGFFNAGKAERLWATESSDCPSKFLIMCLNSIQDTLQQDGSYSNVDKPLFVNTWGMEFWKCYSVGKDILETSECGSLTEQIAWVASTAADTIAKKEKEGLSCNIPFLLFLVPSQEKAIKVRSVCKPLRSLGIHTVSLHPGASLDHQIHGLKSCEPEFLVSTPGRLLELVALQAVDVSRVSVMVVDGLETLSCDIYVDMIISIRKSISAHPHTVVFNDCSSYAAVNMVQSLLIGTVCRLSVNDCIKSQSACILQSVHAFTSQEGKLSQGIQVLDQACGHQLSHRCKVLVVVREGSKFSKLVTAIKSKDCWVPTKLLNHMETEISKMSPSFSVINVEQIDSTDFKGYDIVILPDFVPLIDNYVRILSRMARHSVKGVLHSFFSRENADLADPLIGILQQCGQAVPETLRNICHTPLPMLEQ